MKRISRKYYSADQRHLVEVHQRVDDLWEIEGYRQMTETLPEAGIYTFMEPFFGQSVTDTVANAEKIALETLSILCGVPVEELVFHCSEIENDLPDRVVEQKKVDPKQIISDDASNDPRFKDMASWGVDKDYTPEKSPILEVKDLTPGVQKVLEKITTGGKSVYSVEVCELLILIGKSLMKMGKPVDACRYWYNVSEIANNAWLGGWGTVADEFISETQRKEKIHDEQFQILCPAADLFREYIEMANKRVELLGWAFWSIL